MAFNPFGTFAMRAGAAWRYRLFAIIPGGLGALIAMIATENYWAFDSDIFIGIVVFGYPLLALIFIPYAVYAIEKSIGFLMGDNFLVFDGGIFVLLKLAKYAIAGFFLPLLVPVGMIYVRNENMFELGRMEAREIMAQQAEQERQQAEEAAEIARKTEIREEAKKLMQEMKAAEKQ